jgi:transketolase
MSASHFQCDNLVAMVDYNKYQETGPISREMALEPFAEKWRSFGWNVREADGHDIEDLINAFHEVEAVKGKPSVIIAHTVKGKGVGFVEADYTFHGRALTPEEAERAREELSCR